MDRHFAEVQRAVADDARLRERVHLLSVSFDPAYDTPAVLATHARKVGADPADVELPDRRAGRRRSFASRFGVSIMRQGSDPGNVVHNLRPPSSTARTPGQGDPTATSGAVELVAELRSASGAR